jgi:flagellar hook-basal body complex protein FliE
MNLLKPELTFAAQMPLSTTNARHYASGASLRQAGSAVADMAKAVGADSLVDASGHGDANFADVMLRAVDAVSAQSQASSALVQQAMVDPDSVDAADLGIAQAQASMSLNIAKTVLDRLIQDWREVINQR